jgi:hypothetical protein
MSRDLGIRFHETLEAQRFFCWGKCSQLVMAGMMLESGAI